jgi:hypothetical protein
MGNYNQGPFEWPPAALAGKSTASPSAGPTQVGTIKP